MVLCEKSKRKFAKIEDLSIIYYFTLMIYYAMENNEHIIEERKEVINGKIVKIQFVTKETLGSAF